MYNNSPRYYHSTSENGTTTLKHSGSALSVASLGNPGSESAVPASAPQSFYLNNLSQDQNIIHNQTSTILPRHTAPPDVSSVSASAENVQSFPLSDLLPSTLPISSAHDHASNNRERHLSHMSAGVDLRPVQVSSQVHRDASQRPEGPASENTLKSYSQNGLFLSYLCKVGMSTSNDLIQVWIPERSDDGEIKLSCCNQPFLVYGADENLVNFRQISTRYKFRTDSVTKDGEKALGLPGRVFNCKRPEISPDVRVYSRDEYLRLKEAHMMSISAAIGLPILNARRDRILAVVECVSTSQSFSISHCIQRLCQGLEDVGLSSSVNTSPSTSRMLQDQVCCVSAHMHQPLAQLCQLVEADCDSLVTQVWIPTVVESEGCRRLMCTSKPVHQARPPLDLFQRSSSEVLLGVMEGPVGWAYTHRRMVAVRDIRQYAASDYPLVSFARALGLQMCVAVQVTMGPLVCVLEIFLRTHPSVKEEELVARVLNSLHLHGPATNLTPIIQDPVWFSGNSVWDAASHCALVNEAELEKQRADMEKMRKQVPTVQNMQLVNLPTSATAEPPLHSGQKAGGGLLGGGETNGGSRHEEVYGQIMSMDCRGSDDGGHGHVRTSSGLGFNDGGVQLLSEGIPRSLGPGEWGAPAQAHLAGDGAAALAAQGAPSPALEQFIMTSQMERASMLEASRLEQMQRADAAVQRTASRASLQDLEPIPAAYGQYRTGPAVQNDPPNADTRSHSSCGSAGSGSQGGPPRRANSQEADTHNEDPNDIGEGADGDMKVGGGVGKKKEVPLTVLEQHFHYRLKDAAEKLGVCVSTFKRICREHGITRWPCRRLTAEIRAAEEQKEKKARAEARRQLQQLKSSMAHTQGEHLAGGEQPPGPSTAAQHLPSFLKNHPPALMSEAGFSSLMGDAFYDDLDDGIELTDQRFNEPVTSQAALDLFPSGTHYTNMGNMGRQPDQHGP